MWLTLAASVSDLRRLLNDGPTDKLAYNKKIIGQIDGTNKLFKTFEQRRFSNFTMAAISPSPEGVFVNGVRLLNTSVVTDDPVSGAFSLLAAPADGDTVTAAYYWRWFEDPELEMFIVNALQMVLTTTNPTTAPDGLIPAILSFAAGEAYGKLSIRWTTNMSNQYMLEDAPRDKQGQLLNPFIPLQKQMEDRARQLRKDYYSRNDQAEQPLFVSISGAVVDRVPMR